MPQEQPARLGLASWLDGGRCFALLCFQLGVVAFRRLGGVQLFNISQCRESPLSLLEHTRCIYSNLFQLSTGKSNDFFSNFQNGAMHCNGDIFYLNCHNFTIRWWLHSTLRGERNSLWQKKFYLQTKWPPRASGLMLKQVTRYWKFKCNASPNLQTSEHV